MKNGTGSGDSGDRTSVSGRPTYSGTEFQTVGVPVRTMWGRGRDGFGGGPSSVSVLVCLSSDTVPSTGEACGCPNGFLFGPRQSVGPRGPAAHKGPSPSFRRWDPSWG